MRIATNFYEWWEQHPEMHERVRPIKGSTKWARLHCSAQCVDHIFSGTYCPVVCLSSKSKYAGNLYDDSHYIVLWCKFTALTLLVRPVHTIMLVAYHLLGIEGIRILIKSRSQSETIAKTALKVLRSYANVYHILYYEAILIGTAAAASVGGIFKPTFLYDCRAYTDFIQRKLWHEERADWCVSPCMYRIVNLTFFEQYQQPQYRGIEYSSLDNLTIGLTNLAGRRLE
ncbi:MAG: hypothetical protein ACSNEK_03010 [Parachlamydiaceae bacterium]